MKLQFLRPYRIKHNPALSVEENAKRVGSLSYVYGIEGMTPEQKKAYKKSKAEHYREDEKTKTPLFFTNRVIPNGTKLIITSEGKFVADTTREDMILNLLAQGYDRATAESMAPVAAEVKAPAIEED